jgi:hypothetical protein
MQQKMALTAAEYCNRHNIMGLLAAMTETLLTKKPEHPIDALIQFLADCGGSVPRLASDTNM